MERDSEKDIAINGKILSLLIHMNYESSEYYRKYILGTYKPVVTFYVFLQCSVPSYSYEAPKKSFHCVNSSVCTDKCSCMI